MKYRELVAACAIAGGLVLGPGYGTGKTYLNEGCEPGEIDKICRFTSCPSETNWYNIIS